MHWGRAHAHGWIGIALMALVLAACSSSGKTATPPAPTSMAATTSSPAPTTTSTATPTSTSASTPTSTSTSLPAAAAFVGQWYAHGVGMTIDASGRGTLIWRTYRTCGQDPPPCDTFKSSEIFDGGHATFVLDLSHATPSGEILTSTDASTFPVGPMTARIDVAADEIFLSPRPDTPLCGPRAARGACGA